jgi:hypothetical protein
VLEVYRFGVIARFEAEPDQEVFNASSQVFALFREVLLDWAAS